MDRSFKPILPGMQLHGLTIGSVLDHAALVHGDRCVVTVHDGDRRIRSTWRDIRASAAGVAKALQAMGVRPGDVVATLAGNRAEHLELFYAVPGIGAVLCPVNYRFTDDQIAFVLKDSGASVVVVEDRFASRIQSVADKVPSLRQIVWLDGDGASLAAEIGTVRLTDLRREAVGFSWLAVEEGGAATLAYTSGTTGDPKGVAYTHRAIVLHAMVICQPDAFGLDARSSFLLVVPLCHANAWCVPFAAPMVGAEVVLPGANVSAEALLDLIMSEKITHTGAVPTVLRDLIELAKSRTSFDKSKLSLQRVFSGGSAVPLQLFQETLDTLGARLFQGWGMTETNSSGVHATLNAKWERQESSAQFRSLQGRPTYGMTLKLCDDQGQELPWDGRQSGRLRVRGHWVIGRYHNRENEILDEYGFFDTGDIAAIDEEGFVRILDRDKDFIKSGGEWISSLDLERAALNHRGVREAAVIGVPHPRWQERPVLFCVPADKARAPGGEAVLEAMLQTLPRWQAPDQVIIIDQLPLSATGKIDKGQLRIMYEQIRNE